MNGATQKVQTSRLRHLAITAAGAALLLLERRYPLRPQVPDRRRTARNLALGLGAALVARKVEVPMIRPLAAWVERQRVGLVQRLPLPRLVRQALAFVLLDYTLYVWHRLAHRASWLWRFHEVHHLDRQLDALTALRFHVGEMALSVPYRALQVLVIGAGPKELAAWQAATAVSVFFHHSNLRLPSVVDGALGRAVVTPRMHGVHHSTERAEREGNFSSLISLWDDLHGTRRRAERQPDQIGVGNERDPSLMRVLLVPFNPSVRPLAVRALNPL